MSHDTPSLDIELLLRESDWLRRLATGLLRDPERADDAVQDTWLAALEGAPPRARDRGQLRAWLAKAMRNRMRDRARADIARREREALVGRERARGRDELSDSIEALGLRRDIASAVLALPETQRDVIVLRYLRSFNVAETARELGINEGTVRTRCGRGLAELRRRLDERHRRRDGWALILLRDLGCDAPGVAPLVLLSGGKLALVASVAALIAVGLWLRAGPLAGGPSLDPLAGGSTLVPPVELDEPKEEEAPLEVAAIEDAERVPDATAIVPASNQVAPAEGPTFVALARIVDEAGQPIEGAELLLADRLIAGEDGPSARSDENGDVRLEAAWSWIEDCFPQYCSFAVRAEGRATTGAHDHFGEPTEKFLGTITMVPGGSVRGRVVDESGVAVEGVRVTPIQPMSEWNEDALATLRVFGARAIGMPGRSGANGEFRIDGLPATSLSLQARRPGTFFALTPAIEVRAGRTAEAGTLQLEAVPPEQRIAGRVLARDGSPAVDVRVALRDEHSWRGPSQHTDEEGRFDFQANAGETWTVEAGRPGHDHREVEAQAGDVNIEIRFEAPRHVTARVVATDGAPLQQLRAWVTSTESRGFVGGNTSSDAPDSIELFVPDEPFVAYVTAHGYEPTELGPFDPAALPDEIVFELEPAFGLRVRIVHDGEPVPGARADLHIGFAGGRRLHRAGAGRFDYVDPWFFAFAETLEDGTVMLPVSRSTCERMQADELTVHAFGAGFARAELGPISLDELPLDEPLVIELTEGGSVHGRVLGPEGFEARGKTVHLSCGDGHVAKQTLDTGDEFHFEHVRPGHYLLRLGPENENPDPASRYEYEPFEGASPFDLVVEEGRTTERDLRVEFESGERHRFVGRFTLDGEVPSEWSWTLGASPQRPIGSAGDLLDRSERRESWISVQSPRSRRVMAVFRMPLVFDGPELRWTRDVETGRVELSGLALPDGPPGPNEGQDTRDHYQLEWQAEDGLVWYAGLLSAEDGRVTVPSVPVGHVVLKRYGRSTPDGGLVAEFDLSPGQVLEVVLEEE